METLRADFLRYSRLHSWYKHIPINGIDVYVFQDVGEQARNGINAEVNDISGVHWHFYRMKIPSHVAPGTPVYKVRFGPFLRGVQSYHNGTKMVKNAMAFDLIMSCNKDTFLPWISENYPEWADKDWDTWIKLSYDFDNSIIIKLFEKEHEKYWVSLLNAVRNNTCV
jgi:hypothetical protein